MEFFASDHIDKAHKKTAYGAIIIPFISGQDHAELFAEIDEAKEFTTLFASPILLNDFTGKESELLWLYSDKIPEKRIVLLGLGKKELITSETLRRCFFTLSRSLLDKQACKALIFLPRIEKKLKTCFVKSITEGLCYGNYRFKSYCSSEKDESKPLEKILYIGSDPLDVLLSAKRSHIVMESVSLARDLVNRNADEVTPEYLAKIAKDIAKEHPLITTQVFKSKWLEERGFGLISAVSKGSSHEPALIIMHYFGNPKSHDHTVLVGKGITYDTGGINLKPLGSSIDIMKSDMSGAACVISTLKACSRLKLPVNVSCIVAACENAIGPKAYKPGDVQTSLLGKTVEITNTDAEGRLTLADAITYTNQKLAPTRIIDIATLTGAAEVAFGSEVSALFSNSEMLAEGLMQSGMRTYERLCRLPLYDEYKEGLKSDIADIKNAGPRGGGAILAATFIKEFVGETPWAHIDIAGTAYFKESKRYYHKHATGVGVRLFIDFLEHECQAVITQNTSPKNKKRR